MRILQLTFAAEKVTFEIPSQSNNGGSTRGVSDTEI